MIIKHYKWELIAFGSHSDACFLYCANKDLPTKPRKWHAQNWIEARHHPPTSNTISASQKWERHKNEKQSTETHWNQTLRCTGDFWTQVGRFVPASPPPHLTVPACLSFAVRQTHSPFNRMIKLSHSRFIGITRNRKLFPLSLPLSLLVPLSWWWPWRCQMSDDDTVLLLTEGECDISIHFPVPGPSEDFHFQIVRRRRNCQMKTSPSAPVRPCPSSEAWQQKQQNWPERPTAARTTCPSNWLKMERARSVAEVAAEEEEEGRGEWQELPDSFPSSNLNRN